MSLKYVMPVPNLVHCNDYAGDTSNVWDDFARWGGWPFSSLEYYGNGGAEGDGQSSHGTSRKIVPVE